MGQIFSGKKKTYDTLLDEITACPGTAKTAFPGTEATAKPAAREATIEEIVAELRELEADPLVRLADEEEELRECLLQIRKILRDKQARGRRLEALGITHELVQRYRKDYAETDWGC